MHKKGVDLSVNVIIVAAIGLAVLVVLFMIFTGRLGMFSKGVAETTTCEQACKAAGYDDDVLVSAGGRCETSIPLVGYYQDATTKTPCCCLKR